MPCLRRLPSHVNSKLHDDPQRTPQCTHSLHLDRMADTHPLPPLSLDEHDESVRIAVRALGDMRSGAAVISPQSTCELVGLSGGECRNSCSITPAFQPTPALSVASSSSTPSLRSPLLPEEDVPSTDYLSRVTGLPLVGGALRVSRAAYESSKANSRVVKVRGCVAVS